LLGYSQLIKSLDDWETNELIELSQYTGESVLLPHIDESALVLLLHSRVSVPVLLGLENIIVSCFQ
jgi:hypothetical protein